MAYAFTCSPWLCCYICLPVHGQDRNPHFRGEHLMLGFHLALMTRELKTTMVSRGKEVTDSLTRVPNPRRRLASLIYIKVFRWQKYAYWIWLVSIQYLLHGRPMPQSKFFCMEGKCLNPKSSAWKANVSIQNLLHTRPMSYCLKLQVSIFVLKHQRVWWNFTKFVCQTLI